MAEKGQQDVWISAFSIMVAHHEERLMALQLELANSAIEYGMDSQAVIEIQARIAKSEAERDKGKAELERAKARVAVGTTIGVLSDDFLSSMRTRVIDNKNELQNKLDQLDQIAQLARKKKAAEVEIQAELDFLAELEVAKKHEPDNGHLKPGKAGLIRVRHPTRDFFLADLVDTALKDDNVTMEFPIYSLSTKPDLSTFTWRSKDGKRRLEITPSTFGRATMHDKDILIYVTSQMTEALNRDRNDAKNRVVRFVVHDYLVTTNRHTSGREYQTFELALRRLSGTRIYTNIETGDIRIKRDFGLIDGWEIVEKSPTDERMIAVEITLSEWLFNAIQAREVLTLDPNYFRIRKPIERKIYEIARKHCGNQVQWKISLSLLHEKSGSRASIYEFHESMKDIAKSNHLPQYKISLSSATRVADVMVTVYTRDAKRYIKSFIENGKLG